MKLMKCLESTYKFDAIAVCNGCEQSQSVYVCVCAKMKT